MLKIEELIARHHKARCNPWLKHEWKGRREAMGTAPTDTKTILRNKTTVPPRRHANPSFSAPTLWKSTRPPTFSASSTLCFLVAMGSWSCAVFLCYLLNLLSQVLQRPTAIVWHLYSRSFLSRVLQDYWASLFTGIALICVMFCFVFVLGYDTPSFLSVGLEG